MRWMLTALLTLLAQAALPPANLPPAYPRAGATRILDNDRVTVWEYARMRTAQRHRHTHDTVVVAIGGQTERVTWVGRGTVHGEEAVGNPSRVYVFEIK